MWRVTLARVSGVLLFMSCLAQPAGEWARMKPMVPRGYLCVRAASPVTVDGRLDDAAWKQAPWTADFVDIEGAVKPVPRYRTRAKMLWDDKYFYIAAELQEPHVWGTITQRDAVIFQDPDFEVFIDPDGDGHEYYEFEMNALNTVWDLRLVKAYKDGGPALNEWNIAGLRTGVHVDGTLNDPKDTDRSWTVEIAMPWAALGEFSRKPSPPRDGDRWQVNYSRVEWQIETGAGYRKVPNTPENNWVWSPTGIVDMHRPEKWGVVEFTTARTAGRAVKPGPVEAARDILQEVYYSERVFQSKAKRFTADAGELGLKPVAPGLEIRLTADGWRASVPVKGGKGGQRATIRQDALFRVE
ncbi:MAG: hypothetical protein DVB31_13835 [Verrucomicrobia bacterium]|nr:MAG: hypothetical protein DVB31_13835 [Verrucomicrobiota bacterium]